MRADRHVSFSIMVVVLGQSFAMQVDGGKFLQDPREMLSSYSNNKNENLSKGPRHFDDVTRERKMSRRDLVHAWRLMMRTMSCCMDNGQQRPAAAPLWSPNSKEMNMFGILFVIGSLALLAVALRAMVFAHRNGSGKAHDHTEKCEAVLLCSPYGHFVSTVGIGK